MSAALLPLLLALSPTAQAWTWASPPTVDGEEKDPEGEYGARIRWDGEHVSLLEDDLVAGGLGNTTRTLRVYTLGSTTIEGNDTMRGTGDWWRLGAVQERDIDVGMFANLPDVSYSLADWSLGNERCPLSYADIPTSTEKCFAFKGWMGALNSTHFPPQSQHAWSWYHQLSLATAARCTTMVESMEELGYDLSPDTTDPYGAFLGEIAAECETEALIFEAIGHHYLQDAWSSGHIWQRWGSPNPSDWRKYESTCDSCGMWHALAVGGISGVIHGHKSITGIPDPMCDYHEDVIFVPGGGTAADGGNIVGDYNVATMTEAQTSHFRACSRGSLDEVASALASIGQIGLKSGSNPAPTDQACFDQRVTNEGYVVGLFATLGADPEEVVDTIRWFGRLTFVLFPEMEAPVQAFLEGLSRVFSEEATALAILSDASRWRSLHDPDDTELAQGIINTEEGYRRLTFLGMDRNGDYVDGMDEGLLVFDPPAAVLADEATGTDKQEEDAKALRATFHRAHADYWCDHFDADTDADDSDISELRSACQANEDEDAREAACDACVEMGLRWHRDGESYADYDQDHEPLCAALRPDRAFLYVPLEEDQTRKEAMTAWCGSRKGWAVSDISVWQFDATGEVGKLDAGGTVVSSVDAAPLGIAAASDRVFLSSSDGLLLVVTASGLQYTFGEGTCTSPRGMAFDADDEVLYVACHDDDTVASYDASGTVPAHLDTLDLYNDSAGGVGEEPVAVALNPDGGEIAVATYETYGQRDGVTLVSVAGGSFIDGTHVDIDLKSYDTSTYPWSDFEGSFFANSAGVAYVDAQTLVVSNFGKIECLGGSYESCENRSSYWVTLVDHDRAQATGEIKVSSRTKGVTPLWDGLAAVAVYGGTEVAIIDPNDIIEAAVIDIGEYGADSIAADASSKRIFVSLSASAGTCGLAVIDASDEDPLSWELEGIDTSLYCVRQVAMP